MVEGMVCPAREKPILAFSEHQNPLIHAPSIRIECLQPIDGRQIEAGIGEGHQLPVDQIPVAFGLGHGIFRQFDGVLCSGISQRIGGAGGQYAAGQKLVPGISTRVEGEMRAGLSALLI